MSKIRKLATIVCLLGSSSLLTAIPTMAEVAVFHVPGQSPRPVGPYEASIIDDIDPVPSAWLPLGGGAQPGRFVLNPDGATNGDGRPSSLCHATSGQPLVAWAKNSPQGYDVVLSAFVDGAWTPPMVVAGSAGDELDPSLAVDRVDGRVHLVYWVNGAAPSVFHVSAPADLSSWSAPVQVSLPGEIALRPSLIVQQGVLRVSYESHNGAVGAGPRAIVLAENGGGGFTSQVVATSNFDGSNWPQVHMAGGRLWIDWIDAEGEMTWTWRESLGPWNPIAVEPWQTLEEREYHVRGAIKVQATQ